MCVVDAEDNCLFFPQPLLAELSPKVFGNHARSLWKPDVAFEMRRRVARAIRGDVAVLIEVRQSFLEQVRNQVAVLNRLLERVRVRGFTVRRASEVRVCVAPLLLIRQRSGDIVDFARCRCQTELEGVIEVLENRKPVSEA